MPKTLPDYRTMSDSELNLRLSDPETLDRILEALDIAESCPPDVEVERGEWDRMNDGERFE